MRGNRYTINFNDPILNISLQRRRSKNIEFSIHDRDGRINFNFEDFENVIEIIEDISSIKDSKEKEKHVDLNEYVRFHRKYISDTTKRFNYEFRITEREKTRNVSHCVTIQGIGQINLIKESLIKLHDKYLKDKWLDEKIRENGVKYVEFKGENYEVNRQGNLRLAHLGIKKITEIKGLQELKYLRYLSLDDNNIEEIEGLDHLINLRILNLSENYIKKIRGLDKLVNLENISFHNNPINSLDGIEQFDNLTNLNLAGTLIPKEVFKEAGIKDPSNAIDIIKFMKNKNEKESKYKEIKESTRDYIKKASSVFEEITFSKIQSKTGIALHELEELIEDLIFSDQINAKIRKNALLFIEENPLIDITLEAVDFLRGIKDDTELISQYTSYIEEVFDKTEDIEEYLKSHLASEFEKIRNAWHDYKEGKIDKKEIIKIGIKEIGKKFVKLFIKKL